MRLSRPVCAALLPLVLCLLQPACDDEGGGAADAGPGTDGSAPPGDAPPASGACPTLTTTSELKGSIDGDQTWRGAVAVTGEVRVNMAKITIEAGTTFVMGADASIEFGWNSNTGSLFARGTEAAPIRFCGKTATAGFWDRVIVGNRITSDSVLEHVIVSEGGQMTGAALEMNAPVLVKNVQVLRSGADGVHARDFKEGSERLTVSAAAKVAAVLLGQGAVTRLPLGGAYTGNGTNAIALRFTTLDVDTTFRNPGVPYIQEMTIKTEAAKITFEAGVDYRLAVDQELEIGWNNNDATVVANGTAEKPVLFGRTAEAAGAYRGIILGSRVRSDSVLRYVKIRGGGNGAAPVLDVRASLTVDHLTLESNQTGLALEGAGFSPSSTTLTITTTTAQPATVQMNNAITLPRGGSFTGNMKDWITIEESAYTATGTLRNLGVPYRVEGQVRTEQSSLMIEAGTTFLMAADSSIEFGWNSNEATVMAVGTAASPIVFRGADDVAGYWAGLIIQSRVLSASKFAHVEIHNGGKAAGGGLQLYKAMFDVTNSRFVKSAGYGIRKPADDATDYNGGGNTFDMNVAGAVGVW